jgi:endonuclease YncB( thermonuclease family)
MGYAPAERDFRRILLHAWALHRVGPDLLARNAVLGALAMSLLTTPMAAACEGLRDGPKGTVTQIVDGDTLLLDTGLVARLIGIQAPHLALGRDGFSDWPKGPESKQTLSDIALNHKALLRYGGEEKDRYGRALGQLFLTDGSDEVWVQQQMLAAGMARVYSFPDNRAYLPDLFAAETKARAAALGIWADPYYRVRRADRPADFAALSGHYELVEGRVLKAEKSGGRTYLNFGRYYKEDFTAVLDARAQRLFAGDKIDPLKLGGALVRVRGWVDLVDGPRIEITHPEQIEVLATP